MSAKQLSDFLARVEQAGADKETIEKLAREYGHASDPNMALFLAQLANPGHTPPEFAEICAAIYLNERHTPFWRALAATHLGLSIREPRPDGENRESYLALALALVSQAWESGENPDAQYIFYLRQLGLAAMGNPEHRFAFNNLHSAVDVGLKREWFEAQAWALFLCEFLITENKVEEASALLDQCSKQRNWNSQLARTRLVFVRQTLAFNAERG